MQRVFCVFFVFLVFFAAGSLWAKQAGQNIDTITKEELANELEQHDFFILDVRPEDQWANSPYKIQYAQHEDPLAFAKWSGYYPKEKRIILYCA